MLLFVNALVAAAASALAAGREFGGVRGEECLSGEADPTEKLAGIVVAVLHADLLGHTEIIHRQKHLNLTLHLDDHKYTERNDDNTFTAKMLKASIEAARYRSGHTGTAAGITECLKSCAEADGFCNLYRHLGKIA